MLTHANHVGMHSEEIGPTGEQLGNFRSLYASGVDQRRVQPGPPAWVNGEVRSRAAEPIPCESCAVSDELATLIWKEAGFIDTLRVDELCPWSTRTGPGAGPART